MSSTTRKVQFTAEVVVYDTQHFTPTSLQDSAYAWDRLADDVIGHKAEATGRTETAHLVAVDAFSALDEHDLRLLQKIFGNLPEIGIRHLNSAVNAACDAKRAARLR
jgi:hypothetical protein